MPCQAKLSVPALPVPAPLLQCAMPMCSPAAAPVAPVPPLPSHPGSVCASSSPVLFPRAASHLHCCSSSPPSAPSLLLPSLQPSQPNPQAAAWCGSKPSLGSSGTTWILLLHQCSLPPKKLLWRLLLPLLWLGGFKDVLHHCRCCRCLHPLPASSGQALPQPAAPRGADPLLVAAGQGMPSPTGPALTLPFCHL